MQTEQIVEKAKDVASIPNETFTIIGVLALVILGLVIALIYMFKKYNQSVDINLKVVGKYESVAQQLLTTMNDIKNYIIARK